ncbi:MAG: restriction endonuclease subunit S [Verrucomicrobia bacterium]|nr:restriction endonuclease subunit S [Verrucomicrobiota bacterium]
MTHSKSKIQNPKFSLPRYPRYKDSGVEWLGAVPVHWEVRSLRGILKERGETNEGTKTDFILSVMKDRGVIPYTEKGNVGNKMSEDITTYKIVCPGDLVINKMNAIIGSLGISEYHGALSKVYFVMQPRYDYLNNRFYGYLFQIRDFQKSLSKISYGIMELRESINFNEFKNLPLPLPPKPEQERIVSFLDQKTVEIDALIAKKQRQIELLDEQKAILINRAVTRGLNPNAKLKPSGIEWIGEIPAHWEVVQLKRCVGEQEYGLSEPSTDEGDYTYLGMGQIQKMKIVPDGANRLNKCPSNLILQDKDLLFNRTNSFDLVGKTGIYRSVDFEFSQTITYASYLVRLRTSIIADPEWLNLLMGDDSFLLEARSMALRSLNQANLTFSRVGQIYVPLPPVDEQMQIVAWLSDCFARVATATESIDRQIQSLKSLRSTLIAHAVTGRIKI